MREGQASTHLLFENAERRGESTADEIVEEGRAAFRLAVVTR